MKFLKNIQKMVSPEKILITLLKLTIHMLLQEKSITGHPIRKVRKKTMNMNLQVDV